MRRISTRRAADLLGNLVAEMAARRHAARVICVHNSVAGRPIASGSADESKLSTHIYMRWLACEFVDLEVSAIVPGNEPEVGTPLALITTEPERPESGSTPQWRCLSTHTRIRCDIGHYVHRVGPGHHVVVGRSSMPKSKAIGSTPWRPDHNGPDELTGQTTSISSSWYATSASSAEL